MLKITSVKNPRIQQALQLHHRRERDALDLFLIEGYREILRAVEGKRHFNTLFFSPELFLGENNEALLEKISAEKIECSKEVFQKLSYRDRPDGLLAVAKQRHLTLSDLKVKKNPFLLIAESVEKPGNLGTILRSCDAAGVDAVIVVDPTTDIHNPNVVRSSVGALFTLDVIESTSEETLSFLKERNIQVVTTEPEASLEFTEANLTNPVAIVVGTEQYGLSDLWRKNGDLKIKIPMFGKADSLNVGAATTLVLYEVIRQRRHSIL